MQVFNQNGDTVEISIGGSDADDIQILSAEFEMHPELQVPDSDIEWIERHHAEEIYLEWVDQRIGDAEYAAEGMER